MRLTRRGVALAEAVLAALLTSFLAVSALSAYAGLQRALGRQVSRAAEARTLRAAAQLFSAEWRDLAAAQGDIHSLAAGRVAYRGIRGTGLACGSGPGGLLLEARSLRLLRLPVAGRDSLLVLTAPEVWLAAAVTGPPTSASCPDGRAALAVPVDPAPGLTGPDWPAVFSLFEAMELRSYASGGDWWLGLRSVSAGETIQPALGPIAEDGLRVVGLDSLGAETLDASRVQALHVTVRLARGDSVARVFPVGGARP